MLRIRVVKTKVLPVPARLLITQTPSKALAAAFWALFNLMVLVDFILLFPPDYARIKMWLSCRQTMFEPIRTVILMGFFPF